MNVYLTNKVRQLAGYLIKAESSENQGLTRGVVRKVLKIHSLTRTILLLQAGCIREAKTIADNQRHSEGIFRRVSKNIDSIFLALTDWNLFKGKVDIPSSAFIPKTFNGQVLMLVNSCAAFDQNGYSVRSTQISSVLDEMSIQTNFCARLGYPWDLSGRGNWPENDRVTSDEGVVWLQHDTNELLGRTDPEYWSGSAEYIKRIVNELSIRPTILHAHSKYNNGIAAVIAGRQLGIPVVYELRGLWHLTRAQREPSFAGSDFFDYEERLEVWAAELADTVVVISSTLKEWLIKKGIPAAKIVVIPNAPVTMLKASPSPSLERTDVLRLAFMGSLVSYEGVDTVVDAVSLLIAQGYKISFDIFGDGNYRTVLERQVKKLRLQDHIRFHGQVSQANISEQITSFDIFPIVRVDSDVTRLIPSLKHLEPMAAGKVVLVSALPALLENVADCVAEHAVPPGDSQALAKKLQFLWINPDECARIGSESQQWVARNRNWTENGQRYRDIYNSIAPTTQH